MKRNSKRAYLSFTNVEIEIITLLSQQLTVKAIARHLQIPHRTVEKHKSRSMKKSGTVNSVGLVVYAIRHQLIILEQ
jgi:two-component system response regulator NreC